MGNPGGAAFCGLDQPEKTRVWLCSSVLTFLVFFVFIYLGGLANPIVLQVVWIIALVVLVILFWQQAGKRWGHKLGVAAFIVVAIYMSALYMLHLTALKQARREAAMISVDRSEQVIDVAAMPVLANPFNGFVWWKRSCSLQV